MHWADGESLLPDATVRRAVEAALAHGGRPGIPLAVAFVDDPFLAKLHAERLGDPAPTDVLSFDLGEETPGPAGELYVSVDRARAEARSRGIAPERELLLYVVHGALHLCGYDDGTEDERRRMRAAEDAVLATLAIP